MKKIVLTLFVLAAGALIGFYAPELNQLPARAPTGRSQTAQAAKPLAATIDIDPQALYKVVEVSDGDTFKVLIGSDEITVRLLGVDTPEVVDPRKPVRCYGPEASAGSKSLLKGHSVRLVLNPKRERTDKYGRLLAFVYTDDGTFLNDFLVKNGYAREYTVGKPNMHQKEFLDDQALAQAEHLGLWNACTLNGATSTVTSF